MIVEFTDGTHGVECDRCYTVLDPAERRSYGGPWPTQIAVLSAAESLGWTIGDEDLCRSCTWDAGVLDTLEEAVATLASAIANYQPGDPGRDADGLAAAHRAAVSATASWRDLMVARGSLPESAPADDRSSRPQPLAPLPLLGEDPRRRPCICDSNGLNEACPQHGVLARAYARTERAFLDRRELLAGTSPLPQQNGSQQ